METLLPITHNQPEYTVSEIALAVKQRIEQSFGFVRIKGEISGLKKHSSGHIYFDLKDENSLLNCVCWRGISGRLKVKPEAGLEVVASGRLSTYPGRSTYQLIVENIEISGLGALMALLENRRQMLLKEGLFEAARKKPLPAFPKVIGVITSPTGAVIRDILHRITDRYPLHVMVWPVAVQGEGAAEAVAEAIIGFNEWVMAVRPDLIIVARGGGSVEDLWAFNEEIVVRAAANSRIPLISAIGHETDTTLIDLASDMRAPTPTAAAEIAVPVRMLIMEALLESEKRMMSGISRVLSERAGALRAATGGLLHPRQLLENITQKLDLFAERLENSLKVMLEKKGEKFLSIHQALKPQMFANDFARHKKNLTDIFSRAAVAALSRLEKERLKLLSAAKLLESYHYEKVLARGFALVRGADGNLITSAGAASPEMRIQFHDGNVDVARVTKSGPKMPKKTPGGQESLF